MATGGGFLSFSPARRGRPLALRPLMALATVGLIASAFVPVGVGVAAAKDHDPGAGKVVVSPAVHSDVSALSLSAMTPAPIVNVKDKKENKKTRKSRLKAANEAVP